MNITGITNHIKFEKIFAAARVDGKVSWLKISAMKDLPENFIEKYFSKLKCFGIEKNQSLTTSIIDNHKNELNWYSLMKFQNLEEDCIIRNLDIINRLNIWPLLLKMQKLSLEFLVDHIDKIREDKRYVGFLMQNGQIDDSVKEKIAELISSPL